jgi:hypothetical protein
MESNIPTKEQYEEALNVISLYEKEEERLILLRVNEFKKDLTEYFLTNRVSGEVIKKFTIDKNPYHYNKNSFDIVCLKPRFDEDYDGKNDDDIEKLAIKHNLNISFESGMSGK